MRVPAWIRRLVARAVPEAEREPVLGDLEEVHRRRLEAMGRRAAEVATAWDAAGVALAFLPARIRPFRLSSTEVRLALRFLRRTPLLSLTALAALTVGIALAATTFSVLLAVLRPELGIPGGDRWLEIEVRDREARSPVAPAAPLLEAWERADVGLEHLGAWEARSAMVGPPGEPGASARVLELTPATLDFLPWSPVVGRLLEPADAALAGPGVGATPALLGEEIWRGRFGADPGVVGRTVRVGGSPVTVVGVVPGAMDVPAAADVWLPRALVAFGASGGGGPGPALLGVRTSAVSEEEVGERLSVVAGNLGSLLPRPVAVEARRVGAGASSGPEGALVLAVLLGFLLVVAGNVGTLMVARATARRGELAVRSALGASRARLVGQLSLEVSILVALAAVLGVLASQGALSALAAEEAADLPPWLDLSLRPWTVAFTLASAFLAVLVAGVAPALRATRRDLQGTLQEQRSGATPSAFGWIQHAMMVGQIVAAVGILGAATLVYHGWTSAHDGASLPVRADRLLVSRVAATGAADPRPWHERVEVEVAQEPWAVAVGVSTHLPGTDAPRLPLELVGPDGAAERLPSRVGVARVSPGFFRAVGARPLQGRLLSGEPGEAVVNRPFVERHLGGGSPVGRRLRLAGSSAGEGWVEVVGVVEGLGMSASDPESADGLYLPLEGASAIRLLVRTEGPPARFAPRLREAVAAVDAGLTVEGIRVLSEVLDRIRRVYLLTGSAILALGALVLLLSLLGVYAILSFEVARRTREIGIRVALGAGRADVVRPVLARVLGYVVVGALLGSLVGWGLVGVLRATIVARFPEMSPATFPLLGTALAAAAFAAAWAPLRRVLAIPPSEALRAE